MTQKNDFIGGHDFNKEPGPTSVPPVADTPFDKAVKDAAAALGIAAGFGPDGNSSASPPDAPPAGDAGPGTPLVSMQEPLAATLDPGPETPAEVVDYKALYDAEVAAHDITTKSLSEAEAVCASAKAMGFRGAGIHTGS